MGVFPGLILKPTAVNKAGVFDGANYGDIGAASVLTEFNIQNLEIRNRFTSDGTATDLFGPFDSVSGINRNAFTIRIFETSGNLLLFYATASNSVTRVFSGETLIADTWYDLTIKIYGGNIYWILDDTPVFNEAFSDTIYYGSPTTKRWWVGQSLAGSVVRLDGNMSNVEYYELNSSGNRIKELINLDWNNGDINIVPNIGADKPTNSDMTWVPTGSGTYVDV